jgi:phosphatidylglycerol---prolipoprotein diacylglyceryl transferase
MYPRILHIYGPVWVYSYGVMLALGFLAFLFLTLRHPVRKKIVSADTYINIVFFSLITGISGGRILFILTNWDTFSGNWLEIFYPWVGGLVILGSILGVLITMPFYLKYLNLPILPLLDLAGLYVPVVQVIARLGCFFAGCCYGAPLDKAFPWAVTFTHPEGSAPLFIALHPTQLYTSIIFIFIFIILKSIVATCKVKPGQLLFLYLTLENLSRFTIDFWRGDRGDLFVLSLSQNFLLKVSQYQVLSFVVFCISLGGLIFVSIKSKEPAAYFK